MAEAVGNVHDEPPDAIPPRMTSNGTRSAKVLNTGSPVVAQQMLQ
jgi:hypothetical protein